MELSRYLKIFPSSDGSEEILMYSTLRGAKLTVSPSLLQALERGTLPQEDVDTLERLGIVVPDAAAEREQVRQIFRITNRHASSFSALVTLNLDCNLACGYCYESHFRGKSYMTEETAELLVEQLLSERLGAGKDVRLEFYGGEALLSMPLIRRISRQLREGLALRGNCYSFNIVTNGTLLTRAVASELLSLGLASARITLDGPPEVHDRQRPFASGRGSFESIVANLRELRGVMPVQVGGNFSPENYRRFPELLDILLAQGITPEHVSCVLFTPITPAAGEAGNADLGKGCACSSEPWLMEASLFLRGEIMKRGFFTPKPQAAGCMVEFEHQLVVAFDGSLFKCPAFMGWPDLKVGSLAEGMADYAISHDLGNWHIDECLDCPYLPLCFGGCRFLKRLRTGSVRGVDCRRAYLDATLETTLRQDLTLRAGPA